MERKCFFAHSKLDNFLEKAKRDEGPQRHGVKSKFIIECVNSRTDEIPEIILLLHDEQQLDLTVLHKISLSSLHQRRGK